MTDADSIPEDQVFFDDPAMDRVFGVIFRVATELQLLRATVQQMEALLDRHGITASKELDVPVDEEQRRAWQEDRVAYVENILSPLIGRPNSRSAP